MPADLLEREDELARLEAALARARAGTGGLVVIEGEAGIGKSALVGLVRASAAASGMRVQRARGAELEREFAFGVARQLVEPALHATEDREALVQGARRAGGAAASAAGSARPATRRRPPTRCSRSCTGSTGWSRTSPRGRRSVSRSTTRTRPTRPRCASSTSCARGSTSCPSRSSWRRGRRSPAPPSTSSPR